jgi:photosystem II stability/assembly factor-like uncharacterized protein
MLATNNRGSTWVNFGLGTKSNLNSIKFIDDYTGFLVGDNGLILKTDCRWKAWDVISVAHNYYNKDVSFSNELNGIVVGYKYLVTPEAPLSYASILVTHDGGLTWSDKSPSLTGKFNSIVTFDKDNAIAVGSAGLVAFTNDRGENWCFRRITTSNLNAVRVCSKNEIKVIVGDGCYHDVKEIPKARLRTGDLLSFCGGRELRCLSRQHPGKTGADDVLEYGRKRPLRPQHPRIGARLRHQLQ